MSKDGNIGSKQVVPSNKGVNKSSGKYEMRETVKETYSNRGKSGERFEYKVSSTVKVGDKWGYTEYKKEVRVTRVHYNTGSNSGGGSKGYGGGSKGYNNHGGGNKYLY